MSEYRGKRGGPQRNRLRTSVRSTPTKRHLRQCLAAGKVRFRDKREAQDALHRAVAIRHLQEAAGLISRRQERRAYLCESCDGWHLTSQTTEFREARLSMALWGDTEIVEVFTHERTQCAS